MCHLGIPDNTDTVFGCLAAGDEVKILPGFGFPESSRTRTQVIVNVSGFSALTHRGVRLACDDAEGIIPTGNFRDKFFIAPQATEIMLEKGVL